jgi:cell growth-regulating nucleolar protein
MMLQLFLLTGSLHRSCHAVTCVDCSVTFYGNDYAAHVTCISEAEKYEKGLFKPKNKDLKPKAQDIWNALIEEVVSLASEAPSSVKPYLNRLSSLSNVPRQKKKFINFAKNSLNLRSDKVLDELWDFLDASRQKRETASGLKPETASTNVEKMEPAESEKEKPAADTTLEKEKKSKKKKRDADEEPAQVDSKKQKIETEVAVPEEENEAEVKKRKKDKKEKKEKKDKSKKEIDS